MRKFSRWMPSQRSRSSYAAYAIIVAILVGIMMAVVAWPRFVGVAFGIWVIVAGIAWKVSDRRLWRMAAERIGEDIGTFARAFNRRTEPFDPWVLRATWEALQPYVAFRGGSLPLRPTDELVADLGIDPEDVEFDILREVVERSGHTLDRMECNPYSGRMNTVRDFIRFVTAQPLAKAEITNE